MTIAGDMLPSVSYCTERSDYNRRTSSEGDLLFLNRIDDQVRSVQFNLLWNDAEPEVVDAILRHYDNHGIGVFRWKAPTDSATSTWRYVSPPRVNTQTARGASVSADVERVLTFTT
jgi:hypothetical protein